MSHYQNDDQQQQQNYQSGGYSQQQSHYQQPPHFHPYYQPPKTNGKSIATLVLGICSIIIPYVGFLPGIVGIILGAMSLKEIKLSGDQGRGLAIGGLVCSIIGTILWGILLLIILLAFVFIASESNSYYY
ncbi:DUF4190 domain-containing protein [Paenibacillus sp. 1011MAR3C5]|uniref:DUF4190 domain-containing protein n=1 Tax=Paenibacillus sp. 1011MAR3C5 TaxID=1675787 RepID=UPI000E6C5B78|nr:DUF4190 domain-containing protein [Paenibacillus sp. 1011MAR3C5]RJE88513.1 DUF4190 domain-containing protein [Paenibacillus sp. 1011MAR3C5]